MNTVFHRLGPYEVIHEIGRGGMALVMEQDVATDPVGYGPHRRERRNP